MDPAPTRASTAPSGWAETARRQAGVVAWRQIVEITGNRTSARRHVRSGRWQTVLPGVYATFSGPVPREAWWWAYLLDAGPGAAIAGEAALWLWGVRDQAPDIVELCVPPERSVGAGRGYLVRRCRRLAERVHPVRRPPLLRVEEAVLDVADAASTPAAAVDVVLAAVQRRVTTPARLAEALGRRGRHRRRALVRDVLSDATEGVQSALEHRYVTGVERAHGLPRAERNVARHHDDGPVEYPDLRYRRWLVVIELDGAMAHRGVTAAFRDRARDNRAVAAGEIPLRYGWHEIVADPCGVAAQVAGVPASQGWTGRPRPCGASCTLAQEPGAPSTGGFGDR